MIRHLFSFGFIVCFSFTSVTFAFAQSNLSIDARTLTKTADVFFSPRSATFTEGSTFEVPVLINTNGSSINSMELIVQFDPKKVVVVNPSGGKSIIGIWVEPPSFDNTRGTIKFIGIVPGGITADSGLVATITFRAQSTGETALSFSSNSQVLLNDGYGTAAQTTFGRGTYSIVSKPPEGIPVYSETHPVTDRWYNNNSPSFVWEPLLDAEGYSYLFDSSPLSVPENTVVTTEPRYAAQDVKDGVWYFHLKARKNGVWGNTTHYAVKIDTTPPAAFTPSVDYIAAAAAAYRGLVSFKTTDALSGVDHYEVGSLDVSDLSASPVFIQTESPYQVPPIGAQMRVIVRAFDAAGNTRDASVDVDLNSLLAILLRNAWSVALAASLAFLLSLIGIHYLVRHHILRYLRDAYRLFRREQKEEDAHDHDAPPQPPLR